jgi:hypothetical protein
MCLKKLQHLFAPVESATAASNVAKQPSFLRRGVARFWDAMTPNEILRVLKMLDWELKKWVLVFDMNIQVVLQILEVVAVVRPLCQGVFAVDFFTNGLA